MNGKPSAVPVSVVIPTYNRAAFCEEAVRSVLGQTIPPLEIIVVDDGSTDDTRRRLASLPITYLRQANRGPAAARNRGIDTAGGEYIAFLDSDDMWQPEKLARQYHSTITAGYAISYTDEIWIYRGRPINQRRKHRKYGGWIFPRCLPLCIISPSSVMIHHSVFNRYGRWNEALWMCEDYELWLRLTNHEPVLFLPRPLITKRGGHDGQLSAHHTPVERYRLQALDEVIRRGELSRRNLEAARKTYLTKASIYINGCRKRGRRAEAERITRRCQELSPPA